MNTKMIITVLLAGLCALASAAVQSATATDAVVNGEPGHSVVFAAKEGGFSSSNGDLWLDGTCTVDSGESGPCRAKVDQLNGAEAGRRNLRGLQTTTPCSLISLTISFLELNVLGLVITIPSPLVLLVTGAQGLLGTILCGLLGASPLVLPTNPLSLIALLAILNGLFA